LYALAGTDAASVCKAGEVVVAADAACLRRWHQGALSGALACAFFFSLDPGAGFGYSIEFIN